MFEHNLAGHTFEIIIMLLGSFLLGLWFGWLLWSKYKRKVDGLLQENESLQGALKVTQTDLAQTKDKLIGSESEAATLHQTLEAVQWEGNEIKKKLKILEVDLAEQLKVNYTLNKQLSAAMALSPEAAKVETEIEVSPIDVQLESLVEAEETDEILDSQDVDEETVIAEANEIAQDADKDEIVEIQFNVDTVEEPLETSEEQVSLDIISEMEAAETVDESTAVTEIEVPTEEPLREGAAKTVEIIETETESTDDTVGAEAAEDEFGEETHAVKTIQNEDIPYQRVSSRSMVVKTVRVRKSSTAPKEETAIVEEKAEPIESEVPKVEVTTLDAILEKSEDSDSKDSTGAWSSVIEIAQEAEIVEPPIESEAIAIEKKEVDCNPEEDKKVPAEVKSEEATLVDSEAAEASKEPESIVAVEAKEEPLDADDLKKIEGIGPKTSDLLHSKGISTFSSLAQTPVSTLKEILNDAGYRLANPQTWPAQALLASNGEWDNLKDYQKYLVGGKRPD